MLTVYETGNKEGNKFFRHVLLPILFFHDFLFGTKPNIKTSLIICCEKKNISVTKICLSKNNSKSSLKENCHLSINYLVSVLGHCQYI